MSTKAKSGRFSLPAILSFFAILIAGLSLRMIIALLSGGDPIAGPLRYRPFVEACHVGPAVLAMLALEYGCILLVFIFFQKSWPAKGAMKGLIFGACFGFLWFYGMLEASFALGTSLMHEFLFGLSEMPAILLMGFLAGKLFAKGEEETARAGSISGTINRADIFSAAMIVLFLAGGRFFSYAVAGVEPAWRSLPYALWTIGFAAVVGAIYLVLGKNLAGGAVRKALHFGFIVFGVNWMLFNLFVPYLFIVPLGDILHHFVLRVVLDCCYISGGITAASFFREEAESRHR